MSAPRRIASGVALLAAVAVGFFLRFDGLGAPSYWLDEILGQIVAADAASGPLYAWLIGFHAQHGPLYYATLLLGNVLADGEFAGRLFAAIFGVATIPLVWLAAHRVTNDAGAAAAASLLMALSPLHVFYSREARPYALLVLLMTALLLALLRDARVAAAVLCVLMLYTTVGAATALAAVVCAALLSRKWLIAVFAAMTLAVMPLLYRGATTDPLTSGFPGFDAALVNTLFHGLGASAIEISGRATLAYAMAALAVIGAVSLFRRNRAAAGPVIALAILPIVFSVIALRITDHFFAVRYVIAALAGYVILAGAGIAAMARFFGRWNVAVAVLLAAVIGTQTWTAARKEPHQKLDWRAIAGTIWKYVKPGDLVVAAEPWSEVSLRYYLMQLPPKTKLVHIYAWNVADMQRGAHTGLWLVTAGHSRNPEVRDWACRFPLLLASRLENFRLHYASPRVDGEGPLFFAEGFAWPEGIARWANATHATVVIPRWVKRDETISMRVLPFAHPSLPAQTMRVALNGHPLGAVTLPHALTELSFAAPARLWIEGENELTFDFGHAVAPASVADSTDTRTLAVLFESLEAGPALARIAPMIEHRYLETRFPRERLKGDAVAGLIARLGFDPDAVWPRLRNNELTLDDVLETATWGAPCYDDRRFLDTTFAALLERPPAPHEIRDLSALPRDRAVGRIAKWDEFRRRVLR